ARRDNEISIIESRPPLTRSFFIYSGDTWTNLDCCTDIKEIKTDNLKEGHVTHANCLFTPDFALGAFLNKINQYLLNNGLPPRLIYLNLFPVSVSDDLQGKILKKARKITGWPPSINN
ncbi:MAG: hypothetical protein JSV32_03465, partial [Dehalococcoidia bacterium]